MKVKTPSLLKKIIAALSNKTSELRIRIMIFFLLHKNIDKTSLTHSLHALVSQPTSHHHVHHRKEKEEDAVLLEDEEQTHDGLLMHYNICDTNYEEEGEEVEEEEQPTNDVVEVMEKGEEDQEVGEEDIDQAADLFIQRFKRQIQLQKQLSLERHQRLLESNA